MAKFEIGAWVASLTPLNEDLSVDTGAYLAHLKRAFAAGAAGVATLGTTGEANSFSVKERRELIRFLGTSGLPADRVMVGTGCCAAPDTLTLTRAALDAGFSRVLMLPPFYYKGVSDEGLFQAYARIIEAIDDQRLQLIIYDIPPMTGFALSTDLLARLYDAFPEIVVGVKNSSGEWSAMEAAQKRLPGFAVFAGSEQFLLPTLRAGGPGCISAVANVTITELAALVTARGEARADGLQEAATRKRIALQRFPTIPALKEMMAQSSGEARWRLMRPPLMALGERTRDLMDLVREMDIGAPVPA